MASWHCLLLSFTSLASSSFDASFNVMREDDGDYFIYNNNNVTCEDFSNHTASYDSKSSHCKCDYSLTFSTESRTCETFTERVHYRFDRSKYYYHTLTDTSVSTVYADCGRDNNCVIKLTATHTERSVAKLLGNEPLKSSSNCMVNFVEIMHDCKPRCVPLSLYFGSHLDHKLYLKLKLQHRTSSSLIKNLKGELFVLDITCATDGAYNKKMMFKFSGISELNKPGSFSNVPAYDPAKTCTDMATTTSTSASTGEPNHVHWSKSKDIAIEIIVLLAVLTILIAVVIITCVTYRSCRNKDNHVRLETHDNPVYEDSDVEDTARPLMQEGSDLENTARPQGDRDVAMT